MSKNTALSAPIADYLQHEISASDLSQLLDEHPAKCAGQALHTMIQLCTASGGAITEEQASAYHHIRRLRDLFRSAAEAAMKVEQLEAIAS